MALTYRLMLILTLLISIIITTPNAFADFTPPFTITIQIYRLEADGSLWLDPVTRRPYLCISGASFYGCSSLQQESYPYPTNPATIPIETDYLLDVVSAESMVSAMHATAMQAQAIAARTYAYWHIQRGSIINNSNEFQVFVPYAFERLNPAGRPDNAAEPCASANLHPYQRKVCAAVAPRWYVTTAATDLPIHAEFFADIPVRTLSGAPSYLQAVDDPISSHPDVTLNGHGRGMSQRGSGRWARGNRSFHLERDLGAWSVTWTRVEQLIVHYYTGVQLRDAAAGNAPLLPAARWNPLQIDWGTSDQRPPILWRGQRYPISVEVQNTGLEPWICSTPNVSYTLRYRWQKPGYGLLTGSGSATLCGTPPGDPSPLVGLVIENIPQWGAGAYTLWFDVHVVSVYGDYWLSELGWPAYGVSVCVDGPCKTQLPLVLRTES